MSVVDASVVVDALVGTGAFGDAARAELRGRTFLEIPAVFAAEAFSALRGLVLRGALSAPRAAGAREQIRILRTIEYPFTPFGERIWQLRDTLTVYDAWYVALAEALGTDLVTVDRRLAAATGPRCPIRHPGDGSTR